MEEGKAHLIVFLSSRSAVPVGHRSQLPSPPHLLTHWRHCGLQVFIHPCTWPRAWSHAEVPSVLGECLGALLSPKPEHVAGALTFS